MIENIIDKLLSDENITKKYNLDRSKIRYGLISTGWYRKYEMARINVMVLSNDTPKLFAKFYKDRRSNALLEKEFYIQRNIYEKYKNLIPLPVDLFEINGFNIMVEEAHSGKTLYKILKDIPTADTLHEVIEHANKVQTYLNEGNIPSDIDDLREEVDSLTSEFTKLYNPTPLEEFLMTKLIKLFIEKLKDENIYKRYTNWDFNSKNIMVNENKLVLVDFEFAEETHLYFLDWLRFFVYHFDANRHNSVIGKYKDPNIECAIFYLKEFKDLSNNSIFGAQWLLFYMKDLVIKSKVFPECELKKECNDLRSKLLTIFSTTFPKDAEIILSTHNAKIFELNKQVYELTDSLQVKDNRIIELTGSLQVKDNRIIELTGSLQVKDNRIIELTGSLQDNEISGKNNEIIILNNKLNGLESSISFRFIHSITSTIDKIFPDSTTRGEFRKIIVSSIRTIANEGIRSYFRHICIKIKRKEFKIVDKGIGNIEDRNVQLHIWIAKNEPSHAKLEQYKKDIKNFRYKPKISIITPVYNPDIAWIKDAIESVLKQVYDNWEFCIADASTKEDIKKCLKDYAKKDSRIKVKFLIENKGIAGNSNEALSLATGEYIGLLDHDDEISPDALYEVVKYLQDNDADMIYSDEDKIDIKGNRIDAFFKPDWSPDMFLSCMYTCHFGIYKKKIIDEIKGFRYGYDGSQDYDLVLRFIEKTNNIHHIPKILYHWRMVPGSAAATINAKSYAYVSAKKALTDYIKRNNIKGEILDGFWTGSYRLKRDLYGKSLISIIIPTKDKVDILKRCIENILKKTDYDNYEIIIVNNNSINKETYDYFESLKRISNIKVLDYSKEFNFSAVNNFAVKNVKGDIILFLNNDTEIISEGWMTAMLEHAQRNEVGAVGCKLLYPNKTIQHAGVILGLGDLAGHSHINFPSTNHGYFGRINLEQNLSAVTAACMMMRKSVFEDVGGFDENIEVAFNDVDLCLKIREKRYLIVYTPYAELYHYESLTRGYEDTPEKRERFLKEIKYLREKWSNTIDRGDPYYNHNLTLSKGDFSIRQDHVEKEKIVNNNKEYDEYNCIEKIANGGERVTHLYPNDCFYAHLSIYKFASQFCKDKNVLDIGSGAGYGSAYFANHGALTVLGTDSDDYAVEFSNNYFKEYNLNFIVMDLNYIDKFQNKSFGLIYASNSLEHVKDVTNFLNATGRILKDDDMLIIAVPPIINDDKKKESLANPHHQNSLSPKEWYSLLQKYFKSVEVYRHDFIKKDILLNFSNKPEESKISENDFIFLKVQIESLYNIEPITAIFVCQN